MINYRKLQESLRKIPGLLEGFASIEDDIEAALIRSSEPSPQLAARAAERRAASASSSRERSSGNIHTLHESTRPMENIEPLMDHTTLALTFYSMGYKARIDQERTRAIERAHAEPIHVTIPRRGRKGGVSEPHSPDSVSEAGCFCFGKK